MALKEVMGATADVVWSIVKIVAMVVAGLAVVWVIYAGVIKPVLFPSPTTTENAQTVYNISYYPDKTDFCLLNIFGVELISRHSYPQVTTVKQTVVSNASTKPTPKVTVPSCK